MEPGSSSQPCSYSVSSSFSDSSTLPRDAPSPSFCCSSFSSSPPEPPPASSRAPAEERPVFFFPLRVPRCCPVPVRESQRQEPSAISSLASSPFSPSSSSSSPSSATDAAVASAADTALPPKRPKTAETGVSQGDAAAACRREEDGGKQQQQRAAAAALAPPRAVVAAAAGVAFPPQTDQQQHATKAAPALQLHAAVSSSSAATAAGAETAAGDAGEPVALEEVRVLVVGAGGIGCELCKDLILSGFSRICVVDLDTVDVSNLNRQFFFRQEHVGQSKAAVLAEACNRLLPPTRRAALQRMRRAALARQGKVQLLPQEQQRQEDVLRHHLEQRNRQHSAPGEEGRNVAEEEEHDGADAEATGRKQREGGAGEDAESTGEGGQIPKTADLSSEQEEGGRLWDIEGDTIYGVVGRVLDILTPSFDMELLQGYDAVVSALDNRRARRHLNALCVAAGIPLIEGGSTGYAGQVTPILKGETLCYDCEEKPRDQQRIPVCTLRQRPERPEHCIAWSKMIYELLFGVETSDNMLSDLQQQLQALVDAPPPQRIEDCRRRQQEEEAGDEEQRRQGEPQKAFDAQQQAAQPVEKKTPQQQQEVRLQADRAVQQQAPLGGDLRQQREQSEAEDEATLALSRQVMQELFCNQIQELLQLAAEGKDSGGTATDPWSGRVPPTPLSVRGLTSRDEQEKSSSGSCLYAEKPCSDSEVEAGSRRETKTRETLCDAAGDGMGGGNSNSSIQKKKGRTGDVGLTTSSAAQLNDGASTTSCERTNSSAMTGGASSCSSSSSKEGEDSDSCGRRSSGTAQPHIESQRVWTVDECQQVFERSFRQLLRRRRRQQAAAAHATESGKKKVNGVKSGGIPFDKDDTVAMEFVTAAANLRMHNFHIPLKSLWDAQAIAGAIIPAIAATNAMVAALQVVQLLHMLEYLHATKKLASRKAGAGGEEETTFNGEAPEATAEKQRSTVLDSRCRYVWVKPYVTGLRPHVAGRVILPEALDPPRPTCFVCQQQTVTVQLTSLQAWTLGAFVNDVVKGELGLANPYLDCGCRNLFDPDEVAGNDPLLKQLLTHLDLRNGSLITATDFSRGNLQFDLLLQERQGLASESVSDKLAFSILRDAGVSSAGRPQHDPSAQSDILKTSTLAETHAAAQQEETGGLKEIDRQVIYQQGRARSLDEDEGKPPKRVRREETTAIEGAPSKADRDVIGNGIDAVILGNLEEPESLQDLGRSALCVTVVDDD